VLLSKPFNLYPHKLTKISHCHFTSVDTAQILIRLSLFSDHILTSGSVCSLPTVPLSAACIFEALCPELHVVGTPNSLKNINCLGLDNEKRFLRDRCLHQLFVKCEGVLQYSMRWFKLTVKERKK